MILIRVISTLQRISKCYPRQGSNLDFPIIQSVSFLIRLIRHVVILIIITNNQYVLRDNVTISQFQLALQHDY